MYSFLLLLQLPLQNPTHDVDVSKDTSILAELSDNNDKKMLTSATKMLWQYFKRSHYKKFTQCNVVASTK